MFGDVGHGMIMALFAAWMVLREKPLAAKKSDSEVLVLIFYCLSQHLQKFSDLFVHFVSEVLLTDSCVCFFHFIYL
jgi:vacuolar-type H+-ATPase subunit I/STV1